VEVAVGNDSKDFRFGDEASDGMTGVPSVVPALCIVYWILDFLSRRWTAATSDETEAEGVPMGMMQKSGGLSVM
jgi:hypothetical protein